MADTGVVYLDADFVSLGRGYLDLLDGKILASLPGDGGLALDYLYLKTRGEELALTDATMAKPGSKLARGVTTFPAVADIFHWLLLVVVVCSGTGTG